MQYVNLTYWSLTELDGVATLIALPVNSPQCCSFICQRAPLFSTRLIYNRWQEVAYLLMGRVGALGKFPFARTIICFTLFSARTSKFNVRIHKTLQLLESANPFWIESDGRLEFESNLEASQVPPYPGPRWPRSPDSVSPCINPKYAIGDRSATLLYKGIMEYIMVNML